MLQTDYRCPTKRSTSGDAHFSEFTGPLLVLIAGLLIFGIAAFCKSGTHSAILVIGTVLLAAAVETIVAAIAVLITVRFLHTSFGEIRTAFLKLAAITVFCGDLALLIPMGSIVVLFVSLGLLIWLFELEVYEAIIFTLILGVVRFFVAVAVVAALSN